MIVTVASGKGGTGKTTVATALAAAVASEQNGSEETTARFVQLLDCDVEEPNAHLFLKPVLTASREVGIPTPVVDREKCSACRRCAEVCAYHAIAVLGREVLVFEELCHGRGNCVAHCPEGALREELRVTGVVEEGMAGRIAFARGVLKVGEAMATPVIRQVKTRLIPSKAGVVVLDAPPGTSCPVVECLRGSDFALLVTEPTPFGLHDLKLAVEVARDRLGLPVGVVINRDGVGDGGVEEYCRDKNLRVLLRIPLDRRIAAASSEGISLSTALPEYRTQFLELYHGIKEEVRRCSRSSC